MAIEDLGVGRGQGDDLLRFGGELDGGALVVGEVRREHRGGRGCRGRARRPSARRWRPRRSGWPGRRASATRRRRRRRRTGARRVRRTRAHGRNGGRGADTRGASGWWKGREGREESRSPSLRGSKGGAYPVGSHGPAYLSLEGSSMHRGVGDRTSALERAVTVAGLCRNRTGFATTRRGSGLRPERSTATAPGRLVRRRVSRPISVR